MDLTLIGGLTGLALLDSTSVGTLLLPLAMLIQSRVRPAIVLTYLATIAAFYWLLGVGLLTGAGWLRAQWAAIEASRVLDWIQLVVGVGMLVGSFWPDTAWGKRRAAAREADGSAHPRGGRWRARLVSAEASPGRVAGVAMAAGLVEAGSMLPYLGAIALIEGSGVSRGAGVGMLAAYVMVMCLPALVLLGLRLATAARVEPLLARIEARLSRHASGALWWVVGILGFFVARDALWRLGWIG